MVQQPRSPRPGAAGRALPAGWLLNQGWVWLGSLGPREALADLELKLRSPAWGLGMWEPSKAMGTGSTALATHPGSKGYLCWLTRYEIERRVSALRGEPGKGWLPMGSVSGWVAAHS